jgi:DNA-binding NtrC family response regulator
MNRNSILIVDDDDLVCLSLKKALSKLGYDVETCMDADEALDTIVKFDPDVVLLDIYLTKQNGIDLLKVFQKKFGASCYYDYRLCRCKYAVKAIKAGAYDFLLKPIDLEQLQRVINKVLENLSLKSQVDKLYEIINEDKLTKIFSAPAKRFRQFFVPLKNLPKQRYNNFVGRRKRYRQRSICKIYSSKQSAHRNAFIQINCATIRENLPKANYLGTRKVHSQARSKKRNSQI